MKRRLALISLALLAACDRPGSTAAAPQKHDFKGIDITGADYARSLEMPDSTGKTRTLADFKGMVTVIFFGYTQCPDVCPTTMAELAEVKKSLGADGARVQGVFVSIDPERDTPEILNQYIDHFGAGFVALRGSQEQLKAAAKEFRVFYAKVPGREEKSYTMDHTAGSYVFDKQGRVRLFVRYGGGAPALTADLKALLSEA